MTESRSNAAANRRGPLAEWPTLAELPVPMKGLFTAMLLTLALALIGALGQVIVHDVIPTFFDDAQSAAMPSAADHGREPEAIGQSSRGDLFAAAPLSSPEPVEPVPKPFYREDQFVWLLKWTHIHLFGMNMIFIFLGVVTAFLDMGTTARGWLVALPFVGVAVDIAAMWLKAYISQAFFWLHVPGGGLFAVIFLYVFARALIEMWWRPVR